MSEQEHEGPGFRVEIPTELKGGLYANFLSVWHSPYEFTLDFAAMQPVEHRPDEIAVIPCRVVSRIRIPVTLIFDVLRVMNENMTRYEETFGEIRPPRPSGEAA